jgi:hypothetical protein
MELRLPPDQAGNVVGGRSRRQLKIVVSISLRSATFGTRYFLQDIDLVADY